jgi:hypothetical protein
LTLDQMTPHTTPNGVANNRRSNLAGYGESETRRFIDRRIKRGRECHRHTPVTGAKTVTA